MTCFRASLNVALEWKITFVTKQRCKALKGSQYLWKRGARGDCPVILPWYPSLSLLSLLLAKHMTEMKLNLNFFPLGLQTSQISHCIFGKPVICTNLITCSAKLSLHAAERGQ